MICTGSHYKDAPDRERNIRQAIIFELTPLEAFTREPDSNDLPSDDIEIEDESLESLRQKALTNSAVSRTPAERKAVWRQRSRAIKVYVLKRAGDKCEGCGCEAPFRTPVGRAYLEPHHIRRLSDGGPDHPRWVIAVCPNCHRRAHYAEDALAYNLRLSDILKRLEGEESASVNEV